ncbi:hypothetical protein H4582DRAFT_2208535 [Lactarius indigo]|nr:hypothetical protein H4582DRAFT_2208535 [Lactarius indigo]
MSTRPPTTPGPNKAASEETLHFDFPGSVIVLRSNDSHDFRVLKLYIVICSPVLREFIQSVSNTSDVPNGENLLTFIFPVAPVLPSTTEKIMELLAVAQKIRRSFVRPETALHVYFLAQQHQLRQEAIQAARVTLRLSMNIEDLGDMLEFSGSTGAYLYELWKYHLRTQ